MKKQTKRGAGLFPWYSEQDNSRMAVIGLAFAALSLAAPFLLIFLR